MYGHLPTSDQAVFITLLIRLALVASLASFLVQSEFFKGILFYPQPPRRRRLALVAAFSLALLAGVLCRREMGYAAVDLSLEGCLLAGIAGGASGGLAVALFPGLASLYSGEYLAWPLLSLAALLGGLLARRVPPGKSRFDFSPFSLVQLHSLLRETWREKRITWNMSLLLACLALELLRLAAIHTFGVERLFGLSGSGWLAALFIVLGFVCAVGIPLKIWNNTRLELTLQENQKRLLEAKWQALVGKIQPHFLFNTLGTIGSLIRTDPERARQTLALLSRLLRGHLDTAENFRTLGQELELVQAYLDIQRVRFGDGFLRLQLDIPETLYRCTVPCMVLQPLVENSIKHGLSPKVGGGTIGIAAQIEGSRLALRVRDDGLGVEEGKQQEVRQGGVGISNLLDRLQALYGENGYGFEFQSHPAQGTQVTVQIPLRQEGE